MIQISKDEAMQIRKRFKHASIVKTVVQKKHHKFWTEETNEIVCFLKEYREHNVVEHFE